MNWCPWSKQEATVYHPEGKFDKSALIDAVVDIERQGFKPTTIVMTSAQHDDYLCHERHLAWSVIGGHNPKIFRKFMGCKVKIDDVPRWCVGIEDEW